MYASNVVYKNKDPEISIIVPIHNAEKFLSACIKSIQSQTFNNWEAILIDDGSQDESLKIAKQFAENDLRLRIVSKSNEGVSSARNSGLQLAHGNWITFLDSDDTLEPTLLNELMAIANNNTDIVACCCNVFVGDFVEIDHFFDGNKTFTDQKTKIDLYKQLMYSPYCQPQHAYTAIGVPWGKLYSKTILMNNELRFNVQLKRWQDNIFNMYAFHYARTIEYIDKPLYNYNWNHSKQLANMYEPDAMQYIIEVCKARYDCMKDLELFDDKELTAFYRREMLNQIIRIFSKDIFHPDNKTTSSCRRTKMKSIREEECFAPLFNGNQDPMWTLRLRLSFWPLKNRYFNIAYLLFSLNRKKNTIQQHFM